MKRHVRLSFSLREEPFFRSMSKDVISRIENCVYHHEYEGRQIIYFPDDLCDHVYWVHEGRVKVTRKSGDGRELSFRHLFPGDILGEECLVEKGKRGAYAEALTRAVLLLMRADDFRRIVRDEGEVSLLLARWLCERVRESEQVLAETVFKAVRSRVASGLLRLYRRAPEQDQGILPVTHQEIANLIGSTRETTTAMLHRLRREGIVSIGNRRLTVLDPIALEHAARSGL